MKRPVLIALGVVGAVLGLVALALLTTALWLPAVIEARASAALEREVSVERARVQLARSPSVLVEGISIAGEPPASPLARIEALEVRFDLVDLMQGRVVLERIGIERPRVHLRRAADGTANWTTDEGETERTPPADVVVETLEIAEGSVLFVDQRADAEIELTVSSRLDAGTHGRVRIEGQGRYRDQPVRVNAEAGDLLGLRDPTRPFPLSGVLRSADTELRFEGTVLDPIALAGLDVAVALSGPDPKELYPLVPLPLPSLPPYELTGSVRLAEGRWTLTLERSVVGASDLDGTVALWRDEGRTRIEGQLHSAVLDFDDLAPLLGAAPEAGPGDTASPEQQARAQAQPAPDRVLPDKPFDLDYLAAADMRIEYRAERVQAPDLPLDDLRIDLNLVRGDLSIPALSVGLAGGTVSGTVELTSARPQPAFGLALDLDVQAVDLRRVLAAAGVTQDAAGTVTGTVTLRGEGNSIASLLGSANGALTLFMREGRIDSLLLEILGLDPGEAALAWLADADASQIRCALAELQVEQGVARERSIVFDTTDVLVLATGTVDLREERLDLTLTPKAKDTSFFSAESAIYVTGTFRDPEIGPKPLEALASLLTPIDLPSGRSVDCDELLARVGAKPDA